MSINIQILHEIQFTQSSQFYINIVICLFLIPISNQKNNYPLIMRRSVLIKIYALLTLAIIIVEIIFTKNLLYRIETSNIDYKEKLTYKYQLIFTKVLLILDTFYYASFYIQRRINAIIQVRIVKLLYVSILLIMACRLHFSADSIILFILQGFSMIITGFSLETEYSSIYTRYNHSISTDLNIINMYIVSESIVALKSAIALFISILIMADFNSGRRNKYRYLSYFKISAFLVDRALQRNTLSFYAFNLATVIMFGILNVYGMYYVVLLFVHKKALDNEISVFIEILSLIMILLILYYMYLNKAKK